MMHDVLTATANAAILFFEFAGVLILVVSGLSGIRDWFLHAPDLRLRLARGMAIGLEFKLGSEILRTVIVRSLDEIAIVGAIILLRAALTFLIHWEIRCEEKEAETRKAHIHPFSIHQTNSEEK